MRVVIAVLSVLGMLLGVLIAIGLVGHDTGLAVVLCVTGTICFTTIIGANDVVDAIKEATKAIDELRKANDKKER